MGKVYLYVNRAEASLRPRAMHHNHQPDLKVALF